MDSISSGETTVLQTSQAQDVEVDKEEEEDATVSNDDDDGESISTTAPVHVSFGHKYPYMLRSADIKKSSIMVETHLSQLPSHTNIINNTSVVK